MDVPKFFQSGNLKAAAAWIRRWFMGRDTIPGVS